MTRKYSFIALMFVFITLSACTFFDRIQGDVTERFDDVRTTTSGAVLVIKENVTTVINNGKIVVEDIERRVNQVQEGVDRIQEGKRLIKDGVGVGD